MNIDQARDFVYQINNDLDITFDCPPGWSRAARRKYMWRSAILEASEDVQGYLIDHSPYRSLSAVKAAHTRAKHRLAYWLWIQLTGINTTHDKMKGSYFWRSPGNARQRREMESNYSNDLQFRWDGKSYKIEQTTSVSAKNVYYRCEIYVDTLDAYSVFVGDESPTTKKNIKAVRDLLWTVGNLASHRPASRS